MEEIRPRENFASIDMMRGLAILMVIAVHTHQVVPGTSVYAGVAMYGQMGVQLFFVASAFTLCNSYAYDAGKPHRKAIFWLRRYFRIAPGYYFGIIFYVIVGMVFGLLRESHSLTNIVLNILLVNGLSPTSANNDVVPGGWSIGTEVLFYFIFPLLFAGYSRIRRKIWFYLIPLLFIGGYYLIVRILYYWPASLGRYHTLLAVTNNSFSYYSIINQLPVFLVGMSLWFLHMRKEFFGIKKWHTVVGTILLNCLGVTFYFFNNNVWQPFQLVPFVSALGMASLFVSLQRCKIDSRILKRVGLVSYSGYLLNAFFIYVVLEKVTHHLPIIRGNIALVASYVIISSLIVACAVILHAVVEQKGIWIGKSLSRKVFGR